MKTVKEGGGAGGAWCFIAFSMTGVYGQLRLWIKERNWEGFIVLCFKCNFGGQTSDIENVLEICQVTYRLPVGQF